MASFTDQLIGYSPARWIRGPHLQTWLGTIAGPWPSLPWPRRVTVDLPDGDRLVGFENRPKPPVEPSGVVLILPGLAVDAEVPYVRRAAAQFLELGYITVRFNFRGAGAGAGLATRFYHSGLSDDVLAAVKVVADRHPNLPIVLLGYSMSGNMVLKMLGEQGPAANQWLCGAVAFNPPVDLVAVSRHMDQPDYRIYERCFVRLLLDQARINAERYGRTLPEAMESAKTQREFDALYTCPTWGFANPDEYYAKASAKPVLEYITVPTLVVADEDDPIIPMSQWEGAKISPAVEIVRTQGGGHMGYIADEPMPEGHRRWIDHALTAAVERLSRPPERFTP